MSDKEFPNMAQAIVGSQFRPAAQLPTIQAGWEEYELLMRGRKWPETVIECCRQSYFAGADRLHAIITALPMDANIVGRAHQALHTELRAHDQELVAMRNARQENKG